MPFPEVQRVIYGTNPLDQVICQLRFPAILKIDTEIPAEFQDRIRHAFPDFEEKQTERFELPLEMSSAISLEPANQIIRRSGGKNYEFSSEDGHWRVNLTRTFIALTTTQYRRWEEFREKLRIPFQTLIDIYSPAHFSRVGLRYQDVIRRSKIGMTSDVRWDKLLKPPVAGLLASDIGEKVQNFESVFEIGLSDGRSLVRMIMKFVEAADDHEICYLIDSDFFDQERIEIESAIEKLDYFNVRGTRLFQWCITERLHQAMEPQSI